MEQKKPPSNEARAPNEGQKKRRYAQGKEAERRGGKKKEISSAQAKTAQRKRPLPVAPDPILLPSPPLSPTGKRRGARPNARLPSEPTRAKFRQGRRQRQKESRQRLALGPGSGLGLGLSADFGPNPAWRRLESWLGHFGPIAVPGRLGRGQGVGVGLGGLELLARGRAARLKPGPSRLGLLGFLGAEPLLRRFQGAGAQAFGVARKPLAAFELAHAGGLEQAAESRGGLALGSGLFFKGVLGRVGAKRQQGRSRQQRDR